MQASSEFTKYSSAQWITCARGRRLLIFLAMLVVGAACSSERRGQPGGQNADPESMETTHLPPAEPLHVSLEVPNVHNGQLTIFKLRADSRMQPIRHLNGALGGHRISSVKWATHGRHWMILAVLPIGYGDKEARLVLRGDFEDGNTFTLERSFSVSPLDYPSEKLEVDKKFVALPKKTKARVQGERRSMKRALGVDIPIRFWRGSFIRPTNSEETSVFGVQRLYNNKKESRHMGWDLDGVTGDPVLSAQRGKVILNEDRYYSGQTLVIHHGNGLVTLYFHLSKTQVAEGEMVEAGQQIGLMGESGRVTGPHLHFAAKLHNVYFDPKSLVSLSFDEDPLL